MLVPAHAQGGGACMTRRDSNADATGPALPLHAVRIQAGIGIHVRIRIRIPAQRQPSRGYPSIPPKCCW
ncbi:hypothetical protein GCM10023063_03270 [Arthrobacter methylotrophus]